MADPFSVLVGLTGTVDVVLRAGIECYRFLAEIRDASDEIQRLQSCVGETRLVIESSRQYLQKLSDNLSPKLVLEAELNTAMLLFKSALSALKRELNSLISLVKKYTGTNRAWGKIKDVLDTRRVKRSLERLEGSRSMLTTALALADWLVDLL